MTTAGPYQHARLLAATAASGDNNNALMFIDTDHFETHQRRTQ
jgi:hypothetical protein